MARRLFLPYVALIAYVIDFSPVIDPRTVPASQPISSATAAQPGDPQRPKTTENTREGGRRRKWDMGEGEGDAKAGCWLYVTWARRERPGVDLSMERKHFHTTQ
jgi:hypothetical protein